ncbi:MAG: ricin-type beta-trefoil lectin domain protein [Alphaproteobacteria bacterium]|nr:ricin-type beta-trefoil lectin domain protein [Alphaproteobacteria bacterium]
MKQNLSFDLSRLRRLAAIAVAMMAAYTLPAAADSVSGRISIQFGGAQLCLGLDGAPSADTELTTVQCDTAPTWTLLNQGATRSRISFGAGVDDTYCMDVDTAHPTDGEKVGLWFCANSTGANQEFSWPTPSGQSMPKGAINLTSSSPQTCVAPADEGAQVYVVGCNTATQSWTMIASAVIVAKNQIFTADGNFTVPKNGTYRVLAIGGGGGGSNDEGGAGGSGNVAYSELTLTAGQLISVTVGGGGVAGTTGTSGGVTGFGPLVNALGGLGGLGNNKAGGDGGSGGGGDAASGGSNGSDGETGGHNPFPAGGAGEGTSFNEDFAKFTSVAISAGAGGAANSANASGGGGGGGIVIGGDTSIRAASNKPGTAHGGVGYGAGGAGGKGTGGERQGTNGVGGWLIVEWD